MSNVQEMRSADLASATTRRSFPPQQWRVGLSFFTFILVGLSDGAIGILLPSIGAHYHLDKATLSLLFPVGSLGYLIAALGSGVLLARLGRRAFLALGALIFTVAALLVAMEPPFALMLCVYLFIGFGLATLDAGLNGYIASLPRSVSLLNFLHAFYGIGALLGPVIASALLAAAFSWGATYVVWALLGAVVLLGFLVLFEPRSAATPHEAEAEGADGQSVFRAALALPVAWICAAFLFVYVGSEVSIGSWSYSLLTETRHIQTLYAAWMVSGYWLGLAAGRVALAGVVERIGVRRVVQLCLVGVLIGVSIVWGAPNGVIAAFGLCLTGFSLGPLFPTTIAVLSELAPRRLQQSAIGLAASFGSMGGAAFPFIAGHLAQGVGLWTLLPFALALTLVMVVIWALLQRIASQAE